MTMSDGFQFGLGAWLAKGVVAVGGLLTVFVLFTLFIVVVKYGPRVVLYIRHPIHGFRRIRSKMANKKAS